MEVLAPILEPTLRDRIDEMLDVLLSDDELAWALAADGTWEAPNGSALSNAQTRLEEAALAGARRVAAV
jgi:polyphosphate kinase